MSTQKISTKEAKQDKLFYVVANVIPVRAGDNRCLILKRDEREKVYPGKWATIGGKMEHGDFDVTNPSKTEGDVLVYNDPLFKLLDREAFEEAGIKIAPPLIFINNKLIVRPDGIPVNLMTFAAKYVSGDIKPEQGAFTDFAWVNTEEIEKYDCIKGIIEEVKKALSDG